MCHRVRLITGATRRFATTSPLVAEVLAVRDALILAKNLNLQRICVESDSSRVIQSWIRRSGNQLAHLVAKRTLDHSLPVNWTSCLPADILAAVSKDLLSLQPTNDPHLIKSEDAARIVSQEPPASPSETR